VTRFVFATSTSLDGFLADQENSLDWLFVVEGGEESLADIATFVEGVTVMVEGSSTYQWVLDHEQLVENPEKWQNFYGDRKTYVFTSRPDELARVAGADVEFVSGAVGDHIDAIKAAAGDGDVWIVGGGDLASQFAAAGHLDELQLSIAPVTLGAGAPMFTGRFESDRLTLVATRQVGQFVAATYRLS
jgi:dihydrofolate reductase